MIASETIASPPVYLVEKIAETIAQRILEDKRINSVTVTVRTTLPLVGLIGPDGVLEVSGHAAIESLD